MYFLNIALLTSSLTWLSFWIISLHSLTNPTLSFIEVLTRVIERLRDGYPSTAWVRSLLLIVPRPNTFYARLCRSNTILSQYHLRTSTLAYFVAILSLNLVWIILMDLIVSLMFYRGPRRSRTYTITILASWWTESETLWVAKVKWCVIFFLVISCQVPPLRFFFSIHKNLIFIITKIDRSATLCFHLASSNFFASLLIYLLSQISLTFFSWDLYFRFALMYFLIAWSRSSRNWTHLF